MYLLLGASGVGKTLLVKRLQKLCSKDGPRDLGEPPPTLPTPLICASLLRWRIGQSCATGGMATPQRCFPRADSAVARPKAGTAMLQCEQAPQVGTNLTDLSIQKKITIRELGGCMGPIWSSFYGDCSSVLFMIDAANPTQIAASCVQLLSVLSAEQLASAAVLILFNKIDLPCYMSLVEMKSLFRIPEIISCAKQPITVVETSAREGTGLPDVLRWLRSTLQDPS
ncbi:ADP-ribosylation factor-like protein 16 isoform X2 [Pelodiscus sinensis]|uniref:ADP-ribosylation factor-like protein 16 isoform X2 n=1 Tax=Pelodiscus sinensis TaxID=13735 RepID=UPI003F6D4025